MSVLDGLIHLSTDEWLALKLSLQVAAGAAAGCLIPGIFIAWLLARRNFPGKSVLDAVVHLPLVLPPVAVGYLLLLVLGRRGALGKLFDAFGVHLAFTWQAAMIASAVMAFPLMVRSTRLAIELVDRRLEQAAGTLGAGPTRVFFSVTMPLAGPGIATGVVLAFARSLGEFGATIMFAGNIAGQTRTLPLAMYTAVQVPGGEGQALRLMVISLLISFVALLLSNAFARRTIRRKEGR